MIVPRMGMHFKTAGPLFLLRSVIPPGGNGGLKPLGIVGID